MSRWTHPMCESCWAKYEPGREPVRIKFEPRYARCCWCGRQTESGIYVRQDPFAAPMHRVGDHDDAGS